MRSSAESITLYSTSCCLFIRGEVVDTLHGRPRSEPTLIRSEKPLYDSNALYTCQRAQQSVFNTCISALNAPRPSQLKDIWAQRSRKRSAMGRQRQRLGGKCNGSTNDGRRECHNRLFDTKMQFADYPDDFPFLMVGSRDLMDGIGHPVPDERYDGIIVRALPAD